MRMFNATVHLKNGNLIDVTDCDYYDSAIYENGFIKFIERDGVLTAINCDEILFYTMKPGEELKDESWEVLSDQITIELPVMDQTPEM